MKVLVKFPYSTSVIIQNGINYPPIYECEPSNFPWDYNEKETCLIIEDEANIKTEAGENYFIKLGDLVELPLGLPANRNN